MTGRSDDTSGYVAVVEIPAVAALDTSTVVVTNVPYDAVVTKVEIVPRTAITANATNFGTIEVRNRGPQGAGVVPAASRSWAATNSVAGVKETMTLNGTPANREVKAGDQLVVTHTSAAAGLALPAIAVLITYLAR